MAKFQNQLSTASTVADLFGLLFTRAAFGLAGARVAELLAAKERPQLTWIPPAQWTALRSLFRTLASRTPRDRLKVRKEQRDRIVGIVGGCLDDPSVAFCVALALDEAYADVQPRVQGPSSVVEHCPSLLADCTNLPPAIGHMTPLAACRRWMRAFWYVGTSAPRAIFGPMPAPVRVRLSEVATVALEQARDDLELRIALVSWRAHDANQLVLNAAAAARCFAIDGLGASDPPKEEIAKVLGLVREHAPHIVLFPEVSFSTRMYDDLRGILAHTERRLPALVVVGRAHERVPNGPYRNVGVVLDAHGDVLLEHEKLEPFSFNGKLEDIVPRSSTEYPYVDTPVGRLVVNICRDVRSDVPMVLNRALGIGILLVPAYSTRVDFALEEAHVLGARQATITAIANGAGAHVRDAGGLYVPFTGKTSTVRIPRGQAPGSGTAHVYRFFSAGNAAHQLVSEFSLP